MRYSPADSVICVADVHLEKGTPARIECFRRFLLDVALKVSALYILGDLFTAWPGDDVIEAETSVFQPLLDAFRDLHTSGVKVYTLHGNHDFLMGQAWCARANIVLIEDGYVLEQGKQRWVLLHGDTLCTDDTGYQAFRTMVRDVQWQKNFLALPLRVRLQEIEKVRGRSEQEKALKSEGIMDVNLDAVVDLWKQYSDTAGMIHGHTHRPARHAYRIADRVFTRWVLPDWIRAPGYGVLTAEGRIFTLWL